MVAFCIVDKTVMSSAAGAVLRCVDKTVMSSAAGAVLRCVDITVMSSVWHGNIYRGL